MDADPVLEELRALEPIFHTRAFGVTLDDFARRMVDDYWEIGASGARLTGKAAQLLKRTGKRYALASMCIGGGQGVAVILENTRD